MMKVKGGMLFQNEYSNIFVKYITNTTVIFIEGFSPSAIHDIQEIPTENFMDYITKWGFEQKGYWN